MQPKTKYARSGDVNIAYQVVGDGPPDLVYVPGFVSHVELGWEEPSFARYLSRLASFSRLILFDKRGTGLSDRVPIAELPTLEQRMDDVRAVMDAAGSERAALFGISEGGPMCMLFAATYPQRVSGLVVYGSSAKFVSDGEYPWGVPAEELEPFIEVVEQGWAEGPLLPMFAPSVADDDRYRQGWAQTLRSAASPAAAVAVIRMVAETDARHVLPAIRVPTLIIHRTGDLAVNIENGHYMAERISGARYVELAGDDHLPWIGDQDAVLDEVEEFLTGARHAPEPDRVLATVLFTDIVGSTERAAELGDRRWRDLLKSHENLVRGELGRFRGREVKTVGDGFLATFDGPARGIRCACAIRDAVRPLGIAIRAGLHTGECELMNGDVGGIAVHIGARVAAEAWPNEVLASRTVTDLVAGSGIRFSDRGTRSLKGVPGEWRLFAVES